MTLESYFSYVKADLRAMKKPWMTSIAFFVGLLLANRLFALTETDYDITYYFALICAASVPGLPYRRLIWGTAPPEGSRNLRTFGFQFLRSFPGSLPVIAYLLWLIPHFNLPVTMASRLRGYPIIPRSARLSEYGLCLGFLICLLASSEIYSAAIGVVEKRHSRTTDKKKRALNQLLSLALFIVTMTLGAGLAWLAFCLYYDLPVSPITWALAILTLPGTAAILSWTYRAWASDAGFR